MKSEIDSSKNAGSDMPETLIGDHRIIEEIGRGGMGIVFKGEQVSLGRLVAIKTLPPELARDQEYLDRLENEAKILAKFTHPNIVYIHDSKRQADTVHLIMEYVPGETVADQLKKKGSYEIKEAARIIIRVATALEHAHSKGIIHRDIKPSNIMIREDGVVKVTDFGIAKSSENSDLTRTRWAPGTRNYMSPEQAWGRKDIDGRSDIYSLGIVFYQMVTGKLPPLQLPTSIPSLPASYQKIILRCLAEDRSKRFQSAKDLIYALDNAKEGFSGRKEGKNEGRRPGKKIVLAISALGVVLLLGLFFWKADPIMEYAQVVFSKITGNKTTDMVENEPSTVLPVSEPEEEAKPLTAPGEEERLSLKPEEEVDTPPKLETEAAPFPTGPELRSVEARNQDLLRALESQPGVIIENGVKAVFALKTGFIATMDQAPEITTAVNDLLDHFEFVEQVDNGACDLLISIDNTSQEIKLAIRSNIFGEDKKDAYQEILYINDDQQYISSLRAIICRYYCFYILQGMSLLKSVDDGFDTELTINSGSNGSFQVGETINICITPSQKTYFMLLSVNLEGIYLLFPRIREEHEPLDVGKMYCSEPMSVSPPTGNELVAAIAFTDKLILPIDHYLAGGDQFLIESQSWPYDLSVPDNAVNFCENLLISLAQAYQENWSATSQFIRTYQ